MTKDYELYEPYRDWDPFIERDEGQKRKRIRKSKQKEL